MWARILQVLGLCLLGVPALAEAPLAPALALVRAGDFDSARALRAQIQDPTAQDVVTWMLLRAREGSFAEALAFLDRRGDWPGLPLLRERQEGNIPDDADPGQVIRFFAPQAPETATGGLRYAAAMIALGQQAQGRAALIRAWLTLPMEAEEQALYLMRYGRVLHPHHAARLDAMVWHGHAAAAEQMYPLVDAGQQALARARLALRAEAPGVDALIEAVPAALRDDPGLSYERFRWRLAKGRLDDALPLLFEASARPETLGRVAVWAQHRHDLARRLMREGRDAEGYRVAAPHHLQDDAEAAELEWLAGYIALRKLGDAKTAAAHFTRFERGVGTPISLGRAGYWLGRAYEAMGDADQARAAYARGARYQTSFYGQLAAERAALPPDPLLAGGEDFGDWRQAGFGGSSVLRAALLLHAAGEDWLAERFMTHLAESLTRQEIGQLIEIALEIQEPHIAVMIGKRAAQAGHELHKGYYAVMPELAGLRAGVDPALVLSIGRRESEFDPGVISHAGARGLMQLMPGTAEAMAAATGQSYSAGRLLSDPLYNAELGAAYLERLEAEFGRSLILVPAAYNAGPSRARRWREDLGDPSLAHVDVVDWIEHVPFEETRNYIMRVSESVAVYRARLSGQVGPLGLEQGLRRR